MADESSIEYFLSLRTVAVVGASRDRNKYGNIVYRFLREQGLKVYAVNPATRSVEDDPCYPSLDKLPEKVEGIVVVVPPLATEKIVRQAAAAGIRAVWMQPGAESKDAVEFCEASGIRVVANACILVKARPAEE